MRFHRDAFKIVMEPIRTSVEATFTCIGPWRHISNVVAYGMTNHGPLRIFYPTKDRRIARRVARKLHIRFRQRRDGYITWR